MEKLRFLNIMLVTWRKFCFKREEFLYDLNYELLSLCLKWLRWGTTIKETLSYEKTPSTDIKDLRSLINPKKTDFLNTLYKPTPYYQVFGSSLQRTVVS